MPGSTTSMPIDRLAAHDVSEIDDRHGLADIAPVLRILEAKLSAVRYRQRLGAARRARRRRAFAHSAHGRLRAFSARHSRPEHARWRPLRLEHLAGRSACLAHGLVELPDAARAIGVLVAVFRVALSLHHLDPFQSASSSSATIMGKSVRIPVPISERWATMVTSPVSSMRQ